MDDAQLASALEAFNRISDYLELSELQRSLILGSLDVVKTEQARCDSRDALRRISLVLNIWIDLCALLGAEERARRWLHARNSDPAFGGRSALDRMTSGNLADLVDVRNYIKIALQR